MTREKKYTDLYVYMNGIRIGTLSREANSTLIFSYHLEWLNHEGARPISLSMPLTEIPYKGSVVEFYFDNLLPDSNLIRKRIQARFSIPSNNCFDILSCIGADCVGALQLLTQPKVSNIKTVRATPISDKEISQLLKHYEDAPLGMDKKIDFRISIAGAQEKTALLYYQNKWWLPSGTTPTSHIIKLPIGRLAHSGLDLSESVENEWLCLKILAAFNLPVNNANIVNFEDMKTLVVERFDRSWAKNGKWLMRLPQEDFCQALGVSSALKYESDGGPGIQSIMNTLLGSKELSSDRHKFMKTVFLFWVMGAIDGHAKNFSISIEDQGRYQLTPIYDVLSAYPLAANKQIQWQKLKMAMALKSKSKHYEWSRIQPRHWLAEASRCQFSEVEMQKIIDEIFDSMDDVIDKVVTSLPKSFPKHISEPIFNEMRKVKNNFYKPGLL